MYDFRINTFMNAFYNRKMYENHAWHFSHVYPNTPTDSSWIVYILGKKGLEENR